MKTHLHTSPIVVKIASRKFSRPYWKHWCAQHWCQNTLCHPLVTQWEKNDGIKIYNSTVLCRNTGYRWEKSECERHRANRNRSLEGRRPISRIRDNKWMMTTPPNDRDSDHRIERKVRKGRPIISLMDGWNHWNGSHIGIATIRPYRFSNVSLINIGLGLLLTLATIPIFAITVGLHDPGMKHRKQ